MNRELKQKQMFNLFFIFASVTYVFVFNPLLFYGISPLLALVYMRCVWVKPWSVTLVIILCISHTLSSQQSIVLTMYSRHQPSVAGISLTVSSIKTYMSIVVHVSLETVFYAYGFLFMQLSQYL